MNTGSGSDLEESDEGDDENESSTSASGRAFGGEEGCEGVEERGRAGRERAGVFSGASPCRHNTGILAQRCATRAQDHYGSGQTCV